MDKNKEILEIAQLFERLKVEDKEKYIFVRDILKEFNKKIYKNNK